MFTPSHLEGRHSLTETLCFCLLFAVVETENENFQCSVLTKSNTV